jgi:UDP-3-O-[3-hydroxymyristoyl] glucosamine N-acyltransferase
MVYVGEDAVIGTRSLFFPVSSWGTRVRIEPQDGPLPERDDPGEVHHGNDVAIHAGTVIGSDGFGYVRDGSKNVKIPQSASFKLTTSRDRSQ